MRVKELEPGLYQGALRHVSEDGIPEDIDTVVLMATPVEPLPLHDGYLYVQMPIADDPNGCDQLADVWDLAGFIHPRKVLSICHMGENRSGLLSALILVWRGYGGEGAVKLVQERGPINSWDKETSFWNPGFVKQVREICAL